MPERRVVKKVTVEEEEEEEEEENGEEGAKPKPHGWNAVLIAMAAVAGIGSVGAAVYSVRPQDPILDVKNITLSGFNLRTSTESLLLAVIDIDLTLYVKIVNNNIAPITFTTTIMNIYYRGSLLGQAKIYPGSQNARSEQILAIPAKLDGLEATNHLKDLFFDATSQEMVLHAKATINGDIAVWKYRHHFEVYVQSEIKVDPLFLDVIDQNHRADLNIEGVALPGMDK